MTHECEKLEECKKAFFSEFRTRKTVIGNVSQLIQASKLIIGVHMSSFCLI